MLAGARDRVVWKETVILTIVGVLGDLFDCYLGHVAVAQPIGKKKGLANACRAVLFALHLEDVARRERLKGDPMCCRKFARCVAEHRECSDSNRLGTALLQRGECATDR